MTITEFLDKLSIPMRRLADGIIQAFCLGVLALLIKFGMGIVMANWGNELTVLNGPWLGSISACPLDQQQC